MPDLVSVDVISWQELLEKYSHWTIIECVFYEEKTIYGWEYKLHRLRVEVEDGISFTITKTPFERTEHTDRAQTSQLKIMVANHSKRAEYVIGFQEVQIRRCTI